MTALRPADRTPTTDLDRVDLIQAHLLASIGSSEAFRTREFGVLADIVAGAAPSLDLEGQIALTKLGAWICAFDDYIDEPRNDLAAVSFRISQYERLLKTDYCEPGLDPVARVLVEALEVIARREAAPSLWSVFSTQILAAFEAMLWERSATGATVTQYLHHASESVCVKPVITAAAILLEDEHIHAHMSAFLAAEQRAAVAVRIANDRATRDRERAEGSANVFATCIDVDNHDLEARMASEVTELLAELATMRECPTAEFLAVFTGKLLKIYDAGAMR